MRVNKLNDMMKVIIKGTPLEDSWKTFSNHSARKTAGLERSPIVKVTGHRNEKSLDDYDGDENEQRQLSHTISYGTNIKSQLAQGNSSTLLNIVAPTAPAISLCRKRPCISRTPDFEAPTKTLWLSFTFINSKKSEMSFVVLSFSLKFSPSLT